MATRKPQPGDGVKIYDDPLTRKHLEGVGVVVFAHVDGIDPDYGWLVDVAFGDDPNPYPRTVHPDDVTPKGGS